MAWKAIGIERFRSYKEYTTMLENLTATQERCNQLLEENRALKAKLADVHKRAEELMGLREPSPRNGHTKLPPPPKAPSIPPPSDLLDIEPADDGIPIPSSKDRK